MEKTLAVDNLYPKIKKFVAKRVNNAQDQEDLVQDIFLKLKKGLPQLRQEERLLPWLYRIAHHQIIDYYRSHRPRPTALELPPEATEENTISQEVAGWVEFFMAGLDPADREILGLIEFEGKTQKQAASKLGLTLPAAKSRHQRAKKRLKASLESCCDFFFDRRKNLIGYEKKPTSECCEG